MKTIKKITSCNLGSWDRWLQKENHLKNGEPASKWLKNIKVQACKIGVKCYVMTNWNLTSLGFMVRSSLEEELLKSTSHTALS